MNTKSVALGIPNRCETASNVSNSTLNSSKSFQENKAPPPLDRKFNPDSSLMVNPEDFVNMNARHDDTYAADITLDSTLSQTFAQKLTLNKTNNDSSTFQSLSMESNDLEKLQKLKEIQEEKKRLEAIERELTMSLGSTTNGSEHNGQSINNNFEFYPRDKSPSKSSNASGSAASKLLSGLRPRIDSLGQGSSNISLLHSRDTSPSKLSTASSTATLGRLSSVSSMGKSFASAAAGEPEQRPALRRPRTVSQALRSSLIN